MKRSLFAKFTLVTSGLIASAVGAGILLSPHAFYGASGIVIGDDASLLSEMRGFGGFLTLSGLIVFLGAFRAALARPALMLSAALYLSVASSRLLSVALDGMPGGSMAAIIAVEFIVGVASLLALRGVSAAPQSGDVACGSWSSGCPAARRGAKQTDAAAASA